MSNVYEREIDRLHQDLARIYRRGRLTSFEDQEVRGIWARIERLEAINVKIKERGEG